MVSAWWLMVAFWIGGVLGLVLGVLLASARRSRRDDAEQIEALERWAKRQGSALHPSDRSVKHRHTTLRG